MSTNKVSMGLKISSLAISLILAFIVIKQFPLGRLKAQPYLDNPQHCPYYFTLESLLANYSLIANDKANSRYIRQQLLQYEKDASSYAFSKKYFNKLQQYNTTSIKNVTDANIILDIASSTTSLIDDFYLNQNYFCINPLYYWGDPSRARRILRYNLAGLYDQLPDPYSPILVAIKEDWLTGASPKLWLVNESTTLDTRFMTGFPLLTALYVLPKNKFINNGTYGSPAPWNYFRTSSFVDPITRKVLDIAGIDVGTVTKEDYDQQAIPDTLPLYTNMNPVFGSWQSFVNKRSYGLVYIASKINYISSHEIHASERIIKKHLLRNRKLKGFTIVTDQLYQKLLAMKYRHEIYLETNDKAFTIQPNEEFNDDSSVKINGIVAERADFTADCKQKSCILVFNAGYANGWRAFVNGRSAPVQRANFAFLATDVPRGISNVWLIYTPVTSIITFLMSMISLLTIVILSIKALTLQRLS